MTETKGVTRSTRPLMIMLAVAVLPVVGAYFVFFTGIGMPKDTVNAGMLLDPAISIEPLVADDMWQEIQENKKWHLLIPLKNGCNDECMKNLYTSRQVHIRLAQKSTRLDRIAMVMDDSFNQKSIKEIKSAHPLLKVIEKPTGNSGDWFNKLALPEDVPENYYFLVDQEGRVMMLYTHEHHGNDVLKDIKRALKYSIDYQ